MNPPPQGSCDVRTFVLRFPAAAFETRSVELTLFSQTLASLPASLGGASEPTPTPEPVPDQTPPSESTPKPAPAPAPPSSGLAVPAGAAIFQTYGPWEFKVDELLRGPDGHIQAVVTARNASRQRLPFSITDLEANLIDADGTSVQRLGNLYRVSSGGPISALLSAGASYLEPGDQIRARLVFDGTRDFDPVKLRLKEPVRSQTVHTFSMP